MQQRNQQYTHGPMEGRHVATLSDKEVLEQVARYGPNCPSLWGIPRAQWARVAMMLDMIEACVRIGTDPRMLYFQSEFYGAHRRYGGHDHVA